MRLNLSKRITYAIGAAVLSPALLYASGQVCRMVDAEPTPQSYTWNFPAEASQLLERLDMNVHEVRKEAAGLQRQSAALNWQTHGIILTRIKGRVNEAGDQLCRLQAIRHTLEPWQQQAVDRIAPELDIVARNTEAALEFLNENPRQLFNPSYEEVIGNIYERADRVNLFVEYAQVRNQVEMREAS